MATIQELQEQYNNLKVTPSGKIEFNLDSASSRVYFATINQLLLERGLMRVSTVEDMSSLGPTDTLNVSLIGTSSAGTYQYRTGAYTPNGTTIFASADSGFWVKDSVPAI